MLGRNKYRARFSYELSFEDLKSLLLLYQPLISSRAVILYEHLHTENDKISDISTLIQRTGLALNDLEDAFKRLNEYRLVDSYIKGDEYLFILHKPHSSLSFLNNDLYNKLLRREIGTEELARRVSLFTKTSLEETDGYQNISSKLSNTDSASNESRLSYNDQSHQNEILNPSYFDISRFVKNASTVLLPKKARTIHNLNAISSLADTYGITQDEMRRFVSQCIRNDDLDITALKIKCQHAKSDYNVIGEGYEVPCAVFLKGLQNGRDLTPNDIKLLDKLINDYHLRPSVVNVLVEHALKVCDNHLYSSYLYPIAGDFNRNGIDTSDKAVNALSSRLTKRNNSKYSEVLPTYEKTEMNISDQEVDDLIEKWRTSND